MPDKNDMKSPEWREGFTTALVFMSDIIESHQNAFVKKKILRRRDIRLLLSLMDSAIRKRETIALVGPKKMDLFIRKDGTAELKEK